MSPRRILIVKLSSLGDIVHALPAAASLRTTLPEAELAWLVEKRWAPLLAGNPDLSRVFTVDTFRLRAQPRTWREARADLAAVRAWRPEAALDLQGTGKSALATWLSGARRRVGYSRQAARERWAGWCYNQEVAPESTHIVEQLLDLAAALTAPEAPLRRERRFPLAVPPAALAEVERWREANRVGDFVVLSPGGGWASKRWPTERFAELADLLHREHGLAAVLNRGPGEQAMDDAFRRASAIRARIFSGDLPDLEALLSRARLVVGGDTGPLHLAAALGAPAVALFGPTDPMRNGPFSTRAIVLRKADLPSYPRAGRYSPNLLALSVEEVAEACGELLRRTAGEAPPESSSSSSSSPGAGPSSPGEAAR